MHILGAGLSGLLAANIFRKYKPIVYEKQSSLPNNHVALLRHRTDKVATATTIPFREVTVYKGIWSDGDGFIPSDIRSMNVYSAKVIGAYGDRSIANIDPVQRYISPDNFIEQLAVGCEIVYDFEADRNFIDTAVQNKTPILSTLPMPVMFDMCDVPGKKPVLDYRKIVVYTGYIEDDIPCDVYQTVYFPDEVMLYRASITGRKVMVECMDDDPAASEETRLDLSDMHRWLLPKVFGIDWGLVDFKEYRTNYGKIREDSLRDTQQVVKYLTDQYGIYSVGRYALWRNILIDDVLEDLYVIKRLIDNKGYYT